MFNKIKMVFVAIILMSTIPLSAKMFYNFSNMSINSLDWDSVTEKKTAKKDFGYIGLEAGAGWDWGEIYTFANIENIVRSYKTKTVKNLQYSVYGDLDINIKNSWRIHIQDFKLQSESFYVNDFVIGLAYKYQSNKGLWIRPFLGLHYTNDTYYNGFNGYMGGWLFSYEFKYMGEKFSIFQWNEIEFGRSRKFYEFEGKSVGDSKSYGLNGALSFWWYKDKHLASGLQYRYAKHKLGSVEFQSALIYTLKYYF